MTTWYGMFTGGTPKPVVDKLAAERSACSRCPEVRARCGPGGEPGNLTPEQFAEMNKAESTASAAR